MIILSHHAYLVEVQKFRHIKTNILSQGPFNNYVDKMREGRGSKNVCFCPSSRYKNCPGGSKTGKILSTQLVNAPLQIQIFTNILNILSCSHDAFKDCPYEVDPCLTPSDKVNNDLERKIDRIHGDINGSGQFRILSQFLKSRYFRLEKRSRGVLKSLPVTGCAISNAARCCYLRCITKLPKTG